MIKHETSLLLMDAIGQICRLAVSVRRKAASNRVNNLVYKTRIKELHLKQVGEFEQDLEDALMPWFEEQIKDASSKLQSAGEGSASSVADKILDPQAYTKGLYDLAIPLFARASEDAAIAQLKLLGVKSHRPRVRALGDILEAPTSMSTGSEWLLSSGEELAPGLLSEMPEDLKQEISRQIRKTFEQDYWTSISESTKNDLEKFLEMGLRDGHSIREMANRIAGAFPKEYSLTRAKLVARTESGHALNGGRKLAVQHLQQEVPEAQLKQSWLSVLGFTTRDSHANLDGVPENSDGMWQLGGIWVPWPGHTDLPPENRCNCLCTVMTEFGVSDSDAQGLIDDYNERIDKPPSETPINLDGLSKVSEVESWLKSNGLVEETVNLEGTSIDEAKGIANGVVKGSKVGENQLKLRSVEIVGGQRTESMGAGYSNGRIVINPKHLNAVREHNREAVESYLGGFRNYAWQAADNAKDALEITLAHEMGHHVETALLLDIQGGYRELIDSGVDLGEEVWARLSGYASTHASEGFAEIHAMITTGREYLVPRELVDAYRAALNTADPEPIAVFLKE